MRKANLVVVALLASLAGAAAGENLLPEFTGEWANGGPYTTSGLKEKAVYLLLVERGCPHCASLWPALGQFAQEMADEPVLVVGVLPGASKNAAESYARANEIKVPLYADADRSFEQQLLAMNLLPKPISLQNTRQALVADGKGVLYRAMWSEPVQALKRVLTTARWKVPAAEVVEPLKPAWRAMEFGQLSVSAPLIAQALKARDEKVKSCAETLAKSVKTTIEALLAEAKAKAEAGEKWAAYKILMNVSNDYKDFPESKAAATEMSKLKTDKVVAREAQARTALDNIVTQMLKSPTPSKREQGKQYLQQLIQQFPDTEAAAQAKGLL